MADISDYSRLVEPEPHRYLVNICLLNKIMCHKRGVDPKLFVTQKLFLAESFVRDELGQKTSISIYLKSRYSYKFCT